MEFLLGIISGCIFCKFINPILESLLEILFVKIEIIKENLLESEDELYSNPIGFSTKEGDYTNGDTKKKHKKEEGL